MLEPQRPIKDSHREHVCLATTADTDGIRKLLEFSSERSALGAGDLLTVAPLQEAHYAAGDVFDGGARHFVVSRSSDGVAGIIGFRYLPSAPPVYDPQRGILCIEEFLFDDVFDPEQATLMLDTALQKGLELSGGKPLFIVAVTWEHEHDRREFMQAYPRFSELNENENFKHLLIGTTGATTCTTATDWFFGSAKIAHASLAEANEYQVEESTLDEVDELVALSSNARTILAEHEPIFWRKAEHGDAAQTEFFRRVIKHNPYSLFTARNASNQICGVLWSAKKQTLTFGGRGLTLPAGIQIDDCAGSPEAERLPIIKAMIRKTLDTHLAQNGTDLTFQMLAHHHDIEMVTLLTSLGMRKLMAWDILPGGGL
jgi:hypothetical protein